MIGLLISMTLVIVMIWVEDYGVNWMTDYNSLWCGRSQPFLIVPTMWTKQKMQSISNPNINDKHYFSFVKVRRELYAQCFEELIRQTLLNSLERGLLLLR